MSAAAGQGTAPAVQTITDPEKGHTMAKTAKVATTLGFDVTADARELVDLKRQGLIAPGSIKAANAVIDKAAEAEAAAAPTTESEA